MNKNNTNEKYNKMYERFLERNCKLVTTLDEYNYFPIFKLGNLFNKLLND